MKKGVFILAVILMVPTIGLTKTVDIESADVQQAQKVKKGRFFKKVVADIGVTGKKKYIAGRKKVLVPYFRVTFATGGKYINEVGGITTAKAKVISKLEGVGQDDFQEITNAMYEDLIKNLKNNGYEVLDLSVLDNSKSYNKLKAKKQKYPDINKHNMQFTAQNLPFPGKISPAAYMIVQDIDEDTLVIKGDYVVNFVIINRNEKKFSLHNKSKVWVTQGISVIGDLTALTEKGQMSFKIQQPIASKKSFGEAEDKTKTSDKVGDAAVALTGWFTGSGLASNRRSTGRVEVITNKVDYTLAAEDALSQANANLSQMLESSQKEE